MSKSSILRFSAATLLVVAVVIAGIAYSIERVARSDSLIARCMLVARLPHKARFDDAGSYCWLTDRELAFAWREPLPFTPGQKTRRSRLAALRLDLSTGVSEHIRTIERLPIDPNSAVSFAAGGDGRVLAATWLWAAQLGRNGLWRLLTRQAPVSLSYGAFSGPTWLWTPDGGSVIETRPATYYVVLTPGQRPGKAYLSARRWRVADGRPTQCAPVSAQFSGGSVLPSVAVDANHLLADDAGAQVGVSVLTGLLPTGWPESWGHDGFPASMPPITVSRLTLDHLTPPARVASIRVPDDTVDLIRTYSEDGTRIAWMLWRSHEEPTSRWMHRLISSAPRRWHTWIELAVSRVDGSRWRTYGSIPVGDPDPDDDDIHTMPMCGELQWLPGNRAVSFVCEDKLWELPVD